MNITEHRRVRAAVAAFFVAAALAAGLAVAVSQAGTGSEIIRTGTNYVCSGPIDVDLIRVTDAGPRDALSLAQNCSGRIGRIELSGSMIDGVKIQNAGTVAHDLVIESGFIRLGPAPPGAHQDGVQAMGGTDITFRNLSIDQIDSDAGGGGEFFVGQGGSGASIPTRIVCDHCAIGPRHSNAVQVSPSLSVASGVRNSLICRPELGVFFRQSGDLGGNLLVEADDPRCTISALTEWANGAPEPPTTTGTTEPPTTTGPPPDGYHPDCEPTCDQQIAALAGRLDAIAAWLEEYPG